MATPQQSGPPPGYTEVPPPSPPKGYTEVPAPPQAIAPQPQPQEGQSVIEAGYATPPPKPHAGEVEEPTGDQGGWLMRALSSPYSMIGSVLAGRHPSKE